MKIKIFFLIYFVVLFNVYLSSIEDKLKKYFDLNIGVEFQIVTAELKFYNLKLFNEYNDTINYDKYPYPNTGNGNYFCFNGKSNSWMLGVPIAVIINNGIKIPLSFSYYLNDSFSIGFNFSLGYLLGIFTCSLLTENSTYLLHTITSDLSFINKIGNKKNENKLLLELGLKTDFEILQNSFEHSGYYGQESILEEDNNLYKVGAIKGKTYFGSLFIGLGPKFSFGFEKIKKNNYFNFLYFIGGSFGFQGFDNYKIDLNGMNINIYSGISLRLGYYKLIKK